MEEIQKELLGFLNTNAGKKVFRGDKAYRLLDCNYNNGFAMERIDGFSNYVGQNEATLTISFKKKKLNEQYQAIVHRYIGAKFKQDIHDLHKEYLKTHGHSTMNIVMGNMSPEGYKLSGDKIIIEL